MSLMARYESAADALQVGLNTSGRELKRAYRRMVALHPPDRDAQGFQRIRAAYELLARPATAAAPMLGEVVPASKPPTIALPRVARGATALAVLRSAVGSLDRRLLLDAGDAHE